MFSSDIEKGAAARDSIQQPSAAHVCGNPSPFLPPYERAVNDNMGKFHEAEAQANLQAFDHIQEPKHADRRCMKREWIIFAIIAIILLALVLPIAITVILKNNHSSEKNSTIQTRSATDNITFSFAPLTIVTVAASTVYVTITPTPSPSTSTSIPITTLSPSTTTSNPPTTETVTNLSISTSISLSSASEPSTTPSTSSSMMSPEEAAAWSSVLSQSSADQAALTKVPLFSSTKPEGITIIPIPTTAVTPTTLVSFITVKETDESQGAEFTGTGGPLSFCGVDGAFCAKKKNKVV